MNQTLPPPFRHFWSGNPSIVSLVFFPKFNLPQTKPNDFFFFLEMVIYMQFMHFVLKKRLEYFWVRFISGPSTIPWLHQIWKREPRDVWGFWVSRKLAYRHGLRWRLGDFDVMGYRYKWHWSCTNLFKQFHRFVLVYFEGCILACICIHIHYTRVRMGGLYASFPRKASIFYIFS